MKTRSSWMPGSYALALSEKHNACLRLLQKKASRRRARQQSLDAIGTSTTLESHTSLEGLKVPPGISLLSLSVMTARRVGAHMHQAKRHKSLKLRML
jgi:hypothetical protein